MSSCGVQIEWNIKNGSRPRTSVIKHEASWLLEKDFHLPSGLKVSVQAGTRDSVLDFTKKSENGKILTDYSLRKKYR